MSESIQLLQQANGQRAEAAYATFDAMAKKKRRRSEFTVTLDPDEGPKRFLFVALSPTEYDELVTEHPPLERHKAKDPSANVNGDTFPPALLARVCQKPKMTEEQWAEVWANENYTSGERGSLFWEANGLCNRPLDLAPFVNG